MAYGNSWRTKSLDRDPRDVVEDAARAAGMSVEEWLETANDGHAPTPRPRMRRRDEDSYDRPAPRPRRDTYGSRDPEYDDYRVSRIVDEAVHTFSDSLRKSEMRTANAIAELSRGLEARGTAHEPSAVPVPQPVAQHSDQRSLMQQLESRIENVVRMIEDNQRKPEPAAVAAPAVTPAPEPVVVPMVQRAPARPARDLRQMVAVNSALQKVDQALRSLERNPQQAEIVKALAALDARIAGLETLPVQSKQSDQIGALVSEIAQLQRQMREAKPQQDNAATSAITHQVAALGDRIDRLSHTLETPKDTGNRHFDQLLNEISDLRRAVHQGSAPPALEGLQRQVAEMGGRIETLTSGIGSLRNDRPAVAAADPALHADLLDLKKLIQQSATPSLDGRVLDALQAIERKMSALETAPQALSARLDQLHSLVGSKMAQPAAAPAGLERLLEQLSERVDAIGAGRSDEASFSRLQADMHAVMRKIEEGGQTTPISSAQDLTSIERSMSTVLTQLDMLRADMGSVAEKAARQASVQAVSSFSDLMPSADATGAQAAIQQLFQQIDSWRGEMNVAAEQAARRATHEALSQAQPSAAPSEALSSIERALETLHRQVGSMGGEFASVAEQAARNAAQEAIRSANALAPAPAPAAPQQEELHRALEDIRLSQKSAEDRTAHTLEAVHDTLKRVVGRLIEMEKDIEGGKPEAAPVHAMAAHAAPLHASMPQQPLQPAPHLVPPVPMQAAPVVADPMRRPLSIRGPEAVAQPTSAPVVENAAAPVDRSHEQASSLVAAMRASQMSGGSSPSVITSAPEKKSGLSSVLAAAAGTVANLANRAKKPAAKATQSAAVETPAMDVNPTQPTPADMPLEPDAGRPVAPDPKAQFLAAARRAAEIAAAQTGQTLASEKDAAASADGKATKKSRLPTSAKGSRLSTKHALMLGLAALIVAVGATIQIVGMPKLLGGASKPKEQTRPVGSLDNIRRQVQTSHDRRLQNQDLQANADQRRNQVLAQAEEGKLPPLVGQAERQAQVAELDRIDRGQGLPTTNAAIAARRVDLEPVGSVPNTAAQPSASMTPQSLPPRPVSMPQDDPLLKFEGLKDAKGLKEAARRGDVNAFVEIGARYAEGRGGASADAKQAMKWFERAADMGSVPARYRLGAMYREGRGIERNAKIAFAHFQGAAELGNARAMHNTAVLLAEGVNGAPDYVGAYEWFKKAAEFGIRDSQYNLAILHARGLGAPQDLVTAYAWFAAAAQQGDEDAGKKRDEVGARLGADRLQEARKASSLWKPKTPEASANEITVPQGGWDESQRQIPSKPDRKAVPKLM